MIADCVRQEVSRYSSQWITIGGRNKDGEKHEGGTPVEIKDGAIAKGPPSLKGEHLSDLGDKSRNPIRAAKGAHAAVSGKTGREVSASQAKSFGGDQRVKQHQSALQASRKTGVSANKILGLMPDAHRFLSEQDGQREVAKAELRKNIGMNAGEMARHENNYKDHSTVKNWDTASRDIADRYPELGLHPEDSETPAKMWDILREGKKEHLALHDQSVADLAAEWLRESPRSKPREPGDDEWEPGGESQDVVPFSRTANSVISRTVAAELAKFSLARSIERSLSKFSADFKESDHPRDDDGKFTGEGESGSEVKSHGAESPEETEAPRIATKESDSHFEHWRNKHVKSNLTRVVKAWAEDNDEDDDGEPLTTIDRDAKEQIIERLTKMKPLELAAVAKERYCTTTPENYEKAARETIAHENPQTLRNVVQYFYQNTLKDGSTNGYTDSQISQILEESGKEDNWEDVCEYLDCTEMALAKDPPSKVIHSIIEDAKTLEEWSDLRDELNIEPDQIPLKEFHHVSKELAKHLRKRGEPIKMFHGLHLWGRKDKSPMEEHPTLKELADKERSKQISEND